MLNKTLQINLFQHVLMYSVFFHQTFIYLHPLRENCHSQHTSSSIILRCMKNDEDGWSTYNLREKSKPFVEKYCTYKPTKESSQNIRKPWKINYIAIVFLVRISKYNRMKILGRHHGHLPKMLRGLVGALRVICKEYLNLKCILGQKQINGNVFFLLSI